MFLIPLNQVESVELVIHALRAAGGEADCSLCPARRVCMKQCLSIASAVQEMVNAGTLPAVDLEAETEGSPETPQDPPAGPAEGGGKGRLSVVK